MQRLVLVGALLLATSALPPSAVAHDGGGGVGGGGATFASGPAQPTWSVFTTSGPPEATLSFQAQSSDFGSNGVAFVFSWGDGSSTRNPVTGFQIVDPTFGTVMSNQLSHAWATVGTYSVTVSAVDAAGLNSIASAPLTVTISAPAPRNDCGSGRAAGGTAATALFLTLPTNCGTDALGRPLGTGASLNWQTGDATAVYAFTTTQPGRLLTLRTSYSPFTAGGSPPVWLVDPNGGLRKPATTLECGGPGRACSLTNPPTAYLIPTTLDLPGRWLLVFGDATPFGGGAAFVSGSYTFHLHPDGGGDDCASGRPPGLPTPSDAPNGLGAFQLLLNGQVDCVGSLPYADLDTEDSYAFTVQAGEPTVISVISSEGLPACTGLLSHASVPGVFLSANPACPRDSLYTPTAAGTVFLDLFPLWTAPTDTRGYRLRVATASHHTGDCFSGGHAGTSFATALVMPTAACIGDLGATAADGWYAFDAPAAAFVTIATSTAPQPGATPPPLLPIEVYAPDGTLRLSRGGGATFQTDMAGAWRLRVTQSVPSLTQPPYAGAYGVSVTR